MTLDATSSMMLAEHVQHWGPSTTLTFRPRSSVVSVQRIGRNLYYLRLDSTLRAMEQENARFHFYDANNLGDHDYTDDEAFDTNHLNAQGGLILRTQSIFERGGKA